MRYNIAGNAPIHFGRSVIIDEQVLAGADKADFKIVLVGQKSEEE